MNPGRGETRGGWEFPHSFPPVNGALADGTAPPVAVTAFLDAVRQWRPAAAGSLDTMVLRGEISPGLAELLRWALGYQATSGIVAGRYPVARVPNLAGSTADTAQEVLAWRSGIVDFLADTCDAVAPSEFEAEECGRAIDELFTPPVLHGVLHCPDCLQLLTDPAESEEQHPLHCPVRLRRLQS